MASASYHHGNLRQALLDHAVELARTGGPDAVVLRDVQREAGVSNSAAYRHYSDRQALLGAVQIYGMTLLGERMLESLAGLPRRGPRDRRALARLETTGQAYVDFALAEPGLFRTAFAPGGHCTPMPECHPIGTPTRSCVGVSTTSSPPEFSPRNDETDSTRRPGRPCTGWRSSTSTDPSRRRIGTARRRSPTGCSR